jgi:hypothetical protein
VNQLRIPKPKLLRSNPLRKSLILGGNDPSNTIDDEDIITGYRRRDLNKFKTFDSEDEVSDYVKFRLFLARNLALMKLQEVRDNP